MSERVFKIDEKKVTERLEKWLEEYIIPYDCAFQVITLIKLQMEYDSIIPSDTNTMTRRTLLDMITKTWGYLKLTPIKHISGAYANEEIIRTICENSNTYYDTELLKHCESADDDLVEIIFEYFHKVRSLPQYKNK